MSEDDCGAACGSIDRRGFVERAAVMAAAGLIGIGVPRRVLAMMRPGNLDALHRNGSKVSYPIPANDGVQIDKANEVILIRWQHVVIAFNLSCPHQRAPLRWEAQDSRFECPKHHSKYTPDGTYISGRATRAMDRLAIARHGDAVEVNVDVMYKQTEDPANWKAAEVVVSGES